jgi:hypothetical protein
MTTNVSIFDPNWLSTDVSETDKVRSRLVLRYYQSERRMALIAAMLAEHAHTGVVNSKNGEDYIEHPRRIVRAMGADGLDSDPVLIALAWLHDVVEDTDLTLDEVMLAFEVGLHSEFDQSDVDRLSAALDAITMRPGETREAYYVRVKANADAHKAKRYDFGDNTDAERFAALPEADKPRMRKKYIKTAKALDFPEPTN